MRNFKIILSLVWCLSITISFTFDRPRVLLIGLDGLNPSCLKETPYFKYFLENGSFTFKARSTIEAWSATGWSALLCSLHSLDSGILDNSWVPSWFENNSTNNVSSIEGNKHLRCLFEIIKRQNANLKTGFYYDWDWLEYFGNKYIEGSFIDDEFSCTVEDFLGCDEIIKKKFFRRIEEISFQNSFDFDFFFLYLGAIDYAGHGRGWCGEDYMTIVKRTDETINKILDVLRERHLLDDTYILITSDHGASIGALNHGEQNDANLFVPFFITGPGIRKNYEILKPIHLVDMAPTITKILKLKKYENWSGKAIQEVFEYIEEDPFLEKCFKI